MGRRRSRSVARPDCPAVLRRLIDAADLECPRGHADALRALTELALRKVPARGVFDPGSRDESDMLVAIESVARAHLDLGGARKAWRRAIADAELDLQRRDALERGALQVQIVSDTAYFYAGLAFGLVLVALGRSE